MLNLKNQVCSELSNILFLVSDNSLQRPANSRLLTEVPVVQLKVETINFMKWSVSQISTVHFLHHLLTTKSVLIVITAIGNLLHCWCTCIRSTGHPLHVSCHYIQRTGTQQVFFWRRKTYYCLNSIFTGKFQ